MEVLVDEGTSVGCLHALQSFTFLGNGLQWVSLVSPIGNPKEDSCSFKKLDNEAFKDEAAYKETAMSCLMKPTMNSWPNSSDTEVERPWICLSILNLFNVLNITVIILDDV